MFHLSFVIGLTQRLTLVVGVLALAKRNLHLGQSAFVDEQFQRNNGLTGIFGRLLQFAYLAALQQQFTQELAENGDLSRQIITAVSDDMVSDFTVNALSSFVDMATTYTFTPIREIAGEPVYSEDRSPEFYADEDALYQMVVDLFYLPLDAE